MAEYLEIDSRGDGVTVVTLDNPPMNVLSTALLGELGSTFAGLRDDPAVKAVVVAGKGRAFAAGADVSEFGGRDEARVVGRAFRIALDGVASMPRPVIAAVHGFALGGGLELAMACDLRVAADTARLGQPETLLGIIPGGGATQRLPRLVGPARAKEMIWSGRQLTADEALTIGLIDRVVSPDATLDAALSWAAELASGPTVALGLAKDAVDRALDLPLSKGLDFEVDRFVEVFETDDARAGLESFSEHGPGKAHFTGR